VNAATKDEIDNLMVQAHDKLRTKDFISSRDSYIALLAFGTDMNFSQKANVYYSLLELSYILDDKDAAKKYGVKLLNHTSNNHDYTKVHERIKKRICSSKDWAKFQFMFAKHCV
jgi:hypothetical protein